MQLPTWVLAETFHNAYEEAKKYETTNVFIHSLDEMDGLAAVAIPEKKEVV